jgi:hypothetical protein
MCDFNNLTGGDSNWEQVGGTKGGILDTLGTSLNKPFNIGNNTTTWMQAGTAAMGAVSSIGQAVMTRNNNRSNNDAVTANYNSQINQLGVQQQQINAQAAQQQTKIADQSLAERSSLQVSMGEAGVSGNTANRLDSVAALKANTAKTTVDENRQGQIAQTGAQGLAMAAGANSRMRNGSIDYTSLGLQLATDGLKYASTLTPLTRKNNAS